MSKDYREAQVQGIYNHNYGVSKIKKTPFVLLELNLEGDETLPLRMYLTEKSAEIASDTLIKGLGYQGGDWGDFADLSTEELRQRFTIPEDAVAMVETETWIDNNGDEQSKDVIAGIKNSGVFKETVAIDPSEFKKLLANVKSMNGATKSPTAGLKNEADDIPW